MKIDDLEFGDEDNDEYYCAVYKNKMLKAILFPSIGGEGENSVFYVFEEHGVMPEDFNKIAIPTQKVIVSFEGIKIGKICPILDIVLSDGPYTVAEFITAVHETLLVIIKIYIKNSTFNPRLSAFKLHKMVNGVPFYIARYREHQNAIEYEDIVFEPGELSDAENFFD